jgi:hypothetical protein
MRSRAQGECGGASMWLAGWRVTPCIRRSTGDRKFPENSEINRELFLFHQVSCHFIRNISGLGYFHLDNNREYPRG